MAKLMEKSTHIITSQESWCISSCTGKVCHDHRNLRYIALNRGHEGNMCRVAKFVWSWIKIKNKDAQLFIVFLRIDFERIELIAPQIVRCNTYKFEAKKLLVNFHQTFNRLFHGEIFTKLILIKRIGCLLVLLFEVG